METSVAEIEGNPGSTKLMFLYVTPASLRFDHKPQTNTEDSASQNGIIIGNFRDDSFTLENLDVRKSTN